MPTRRENYSPVGLCPACGAGWKQIHSLTLPTDEHPLVFYACEQCGHKAIYNVYGRERIPGKHIAVSIWEQVGNPEWKPPPLVPIAQADAFETGSAGPTIASKSGRIG